MRRVLGIALALWLAQAGVAVADDTAARAEAGRLTAQSAEAEKRGDHRAALDGLRNAYRVFPSANLHYNIASMLAKLGMFAEAADEYEAFLAGAQASPAKYRSFAQYEVAELDKRLARLAISSGEDGAAVTIDGKGVGSTPFPKPLRVLPGAHVVVATKHGFQTTSQVVVVAGESRSVELSVTRPTSLAIPATAHADKPASGDAAAVALAAPPPERTPRERRRRVATWVVGGTGLAALVGSLTAGLLAHARYGQLNTACVNGRCDLATTPNAQSLIDGGRAAGLTSDVLLGIGVAAVTAGVALFFVEGRHPHARPTISLGRAAELDGASPLSASTP